MKTERTEMSQFDRVIQSKSDSVQNIPFVPRKRVAHTST